MLLAEARIGAELKAAQERGDVATQDHHGAGIQSSVRGADTRPATLSDLGIPRQRAAELKAAQARGDFHSREDNLRRGPEVRAADIGKPFLSDLGIPRQRTAELKAAQERGEVAT